MGSALFISVLDCGEWSVPGTNRIGCMVSSRTCLNALQKTEVSCTCPDSNHESLAVQSVAQFAIPITHFNSSVEHKIWHACHATDEVVFSNLQQSVKAWQMQKLCGEGDTIAIYGHELAHDNRASRNKQHFF